jgi:hypothetical protein
MRVASVFYKTKGIHPRTSLNIYVRNLADGWFAWLTRSYKLFKHSIKAGLNATSSNNTAIGKKREHRSALKLFIVRKYL